MHTQIASVVTKCLDTVFADHPDGPFEFQIEWKKKRGKTEAELEFVHDGYVVDPNDAESGGVVDIAVFALRLAYILRSMPQLRRFIVLDEPFKHLDTDLHPIADQLLMELAKETKTQFVIITHSKTIRGGKVIRF